MVNSWSVRLPILNLSLAKSRKSAGSERRSAVGPNRTLAVPRKRDFRAGPQFDAIYAIFCTPNLLPLGLNCRPPPTISDCHRISANQGGFQLPVILTRQDFGGPSRNRITRTFLKYSNYMISSFACQCPQSGPQNFFLQKQSNRLLRSINCSISRPRQFDGRFNAPRARNRRAARDFSNQRTGAAT